MSQNFYKQVALSQFIIIGWILYAFFFYLLDNDEVGFRGLGLYFFFLESCMWVSGIGLLVGILRLTWFKRANKEVLGKTFIYVLAGICNGYLVMIWTVLLISGLLEFEYVYVGFLFAAILPAVIILKDFYTAKRSAKSDAVIEPVD